MHSKPVSSIDQWGPSLRFLDERAKELVLGEVSKLDAPLRNDATVVCLSEHQKQLANDQGLM